MNNLFEKVEAARYFVNDVIKGTHIDGAIITGTGLGDLWNEMEILHSIPYHEIPHFPKNTVTSHSGILYICKAEGKNIAVFSGRFHYYEGYEASILAFPVRLMNQLGIQNLLVTNVAGGLQEKHKPGSIVGIRDHINMQPGHVLRGVNEERWGDRFPDMLETYNLQRLRDLESYAAESGIDFSTGVYLVLQGPSLETPAEYEFAHNIGADLVGMSTVPEVIAAKHMGMKVNAISVVSNVCYPIDRISETSVEDVISVAKKTIPNLNKIVFKWIRILDHASSDTIGQD